MKKTAIFLCILMITASGCKTLQENIEARKNLLKCKYEFQNIVLTKVNTKGLKVRSADFNVNLKITNTTRSDIALDHVDGTIFLDKHKAATLSHKRFIRIKPGTSTVEPLLLHVPFSDAVKALGKFPQNITIAAKIYMTIMMDTINVKILIPVDVKQTFPVPYKALTRSIKKGIKLPF